VNKTTFSWIFQQEEHLNSVIWMLILQSGSKNAVKQEAENEQGGNWRLNNLEVGYNNPPCPAAGIWPERS